MVMVYRLIAEATIEQDVAARLKQKMEEEYNVKRAVREHGERIRGG
jgi:SNF2 family DNA or RNA helicase